MPGRAAKRPTLRTIADLAGLAVPTVSRALSDAPDIGSKTKQRVREIAKSVGYVPNRAGIGLRTGRTHVISLLFAMNDETAQHTGHLALAVSQALAKHNYDLHVVPCGLGEDLLAPLHQVVDAHGSDAIILNQTEQNDSRVSYLLEQQFPFVTYGRTRWSNAHAYFDYDNKSYAQEAMRDLHAKGCRHVAMVAPYLRLFCADDMIAGAQMEAEALGMSFDIVAGASDLDPSPIIAEAVSALLETKPSVDGLICASTGAMVASLQAAKAQGRTIGQSIEIHAKGPSASRFRQDAQVTMATENMYDVGDFLAQAVVSAIETPDADPMQRLAPLVAVD